MKSKFCLIWSLHLGRECLDKVKNSAPASPGIKDAASGQVMPELSKKSHPGRGRIEQVPGKAT